jgi:hypothetical protein
LITKDDLELVVGQLRRLRAGQEVVEIRLADADAAWADADGGELAAVDPLSGLPGYAELFFRSQPGSGNLALAVRIIGRL